MSPSTCHSTMDTRPFSLDHFIRSGEHLRWNRQANLLCRLQIDHKLELRWLLYRQLARLGAFKDLVDEICDAPVALREVSPVRHEPTVIYKLSVAVHRR